MSRRVSIFGSSFVSWEPETVAYMTAVGIPADGAASIYGVTNLAVWQAWDAFFVTLKGAGLLSKHYYIRGMTGAVANAANYKFNAINPLDTNAAYRAVYFGGVTFTPQGTQGNGTNGYANSFFNDLTAGVATNDFGMTSYIRTNSVRTENIMGAVNGIGSFNLQLPRANATTDSNYTYDNSTFSGNYLTTSAGALTQTRTPSEANTQRVYQSGVLKRSRTAFAPTALINFSIYEMARNAFGSADLFANRQIAYHAVHRGMTGAEVATYHTAIQALQVGLNRSV
jgi:hypothetical protein